MLLVTKMDKFYYYLLSVIASAIPIIGYILNPGTVGIFVIIQNVLLIYVFLRLKRAGFFKSIMIPSIIKWYFIVILMGILNYLLFGEKNNLNNLLLISSILNQTSFLYCFMVSGTDSLKFFFKSFVIVFIPCSVFSYQYFDGFLGFDYPHIISYLALFVVLGSFFPKRISLPLLIIYAIAIISDVSVRACLLTFLFCMFVIVMKYFMPHKLFVKSAKRLRICLFALPIFFVILGYMGNFNVFANLEENDFSELNIGSGRKDDSRKINTDSRTGVYQDVIGSVEGSVDFIFGKGEVINLDVDWISTRHSVEVGILNVFLRYGILGCFVFFLMFWKISNLGMYKTNNTLTLLASLFVAYKFAYMFIEDPNINIATYISLGICINDKIRMMTDAKLIDYLGLQTVKRKMTLKY